MFQSWMIVRLDIPEGGSIEGFAEGGGKWGGVSSFARGGVWGLAPSPENFGTFSLETAHFGANSVVYFNRNVRLFTARTTAVTVQCESTPPLRFSEIFSETVRNF